MDKTGFAGEKRRTNPSANHVISSCFSFVFNCMCAERHKNNLKTAHEQFTRMDGRTNFQYHYDSAPMSCAMPVGNRACARPGLGIITHSIRISSFLRGGGDYYISSWPYHQSRRHKCVNTVVAHIKRRENNTRPRRGLSKRINYRRIYVRLG